MSGVTRADFDDINAYLTATDDGSCPIWHTGAIPSRHHGVSSSWERAHRPTFLPNDDNLRRFVPVYFQRRQVQQRGGRQGLPRQPPRVSYGPKPSTCTTRASRRGCRTRSRNMQRAATGRARSADTIMEDAVQAWLSAPQNGVRVAFTLAELAAGIGLVTEDSPAKLAMRDQHRIASILHSLGYSPSRKRREDGSRVKAWDLSD